MKTREEIIKAFEEAVAATEGGEATKEVVASAVKAVSAKATDLFGGKGVFVSGRVNVDMQGISFRFKRPAVRVWEEVFISLPVIKPASERPAEPGGNSGGTEEGSSGLTDQAHRLGLLRELNGQLGEDDYTATGKPEVSALNNLIGEGVEPFTAAERDTLWITISGELSA